MSNTKGTSAIVPPSGGGAQSGMGEKFSPDLFTGTGNFSVPVAVPAGRNGFQPELTLGYSTGNGNGPFGMGWALGIPGVTRKTNRGIPVYNDNEDVFLLSGAEDLVPVKQERETVQAGTDSITWLRTHYRPRTEGLFAKIIHHKKSNGEDYWEVKSKDGLISIYDQTVANPENRTAIFAWHLGKTIDPFGNEIIYEYERELVLSTNAAQPHSYDQLYLSSIRYAQYYEHTVKKYLCEVRFSYEERPDAFSVYRQGFEMRTTRRCNRIETYTHTDEVRKVKTYHFNYSKELPLNGASLLSNVSVEGHKGDESEWMPPLEFGYSVFKPSIRALRKLSGEIPLLSLAQPGFELTDVTGNGLPDLLQMDGTGSRYWPNKGNGDFASPKTIPVSPSITLASEGVRLIDANGDGRNDLLVNNGVQAGYFSGSFNNVWDEKSYRPYRSVPSFSFADPEVQFMDLNGDGITDVLRNGAKFECYFNDPEQGFDKMRVADKTFADFSFADPRIRFADMTGDGLQDIVLISSGRVQYWPNLGYGRFGKMVNMKNAPRFPEQYHPHQVLLGDLDGDGQADIAFVEMDDVTLYVNQSGNGFSDGVRISGTPVIHGLDSLRLVDIMGTGQSGILWSQISMLPLEGWMYFLDFTGGNKPYLLQEMNNNMGSITRVEYGSSIYHYLRDDRKAETRWKTQLPFPVLVVNKVEVLDLLSGGKLATQYNYHNGYWDGAEREFRGFAQVDAQDTETFERFRTTSLIKQEANNLNIPEHLSFEQYTPPVLTKSWFYPGPVGPDFARWEDIDFSYQYWQGDRNLLERTRQTSDLLASLPRRARRDALRTLRGTLLHSETYALDNSPLQDRPYTVTENLMGLRMEFEPSQNPGLFAGWKKSGQGYWAGSGYVFFPFGVAQRTTQYERGNDPMHSFSFTKDYDQYGNAIGQLSVGLPRGANPLGGGNGSYLGTYGISEYIYKDIANEQYMVDRVKRSVSYDATRFAGSTSVFAYRDTIFNSNTLPVIGCTLSYYDGEAFEGLPYGQIGSFGVPVRTEALILTEEIVDKAYGGVPLLLQESPVWTFDYPVEFRNLYPEQGGYLYRTANGTMYPMTGWYAPGEKLKYDFQDNFIDNPVGLVLESKDAFDNLSTIEYDSYQLLPVNAKQWLNTTEYLETKAEYDYRILQVDKIIDLNNNITVFYYSPLGLLAATALIGKGTEGDYKSSTGSFYDKYAPSMRMEYDFFAFKNEGNPVWVKTIQREEHYQQNPDSETIIKVEYSDGFGRLLQTRAQAEDVIFGNETFGTSGLSPDQNSGNTSAVGKERNTSDPLNVVVSGWQIYNNKGKVVEQYEPFFDKGFDYSLPQLSSIGGTVAPQRGVKLKMYYDPLGRVIRTVNPDSSEQRVIYGIPNTLHNPDNFLPTPWENYAYDANDLAPLTNPNNNPVPQSNWYTPKSSLVDALGRTIRTIEHKAHYNAVSEAYENVEMRYLYDIRGNLLEVRDPYNRKVFEYIYDLRPPGQDENGESQPLPPLWTKHIDSAESTTVFDATEKPIESKDAKDARSLTAYDILQRPTYGWSQNNGSDSLRLTAYAVYGENATNPKASNLLGQLWQQYDESGKIESVAFDFKGNLLAKKQQVISNAVLKTALDNYETYLVDWTGLPNILDTIVFETGSTYDALNRVTQITLPENVNNDRKQIIPAYNRAGALEKVSYDGTEYVENIAYNAKGQRLLITFGNTIMTRYTYDSFTFRLLRQRSEKYVKSQAGNTITYTPQSGTNKQDDKYIYDLIGNILNIQLNTTACGVGGTDSLNREFDYDPLYRLLSATGRENVQGGNYPFPGWNDQIRSSDPNTTQAYTRKYNYDKVGNIQQIKQIGTSGFTRDFSYIAESNQLQTVEIGANQYDYSHDNVGNQLTENTERHFEWDAANRLLLFKNQVGSSEPSIIAQYLYDSSGNRVKKIVRKQGGDFEITTYIDDIFEYFTDETEEQNTVYVIDDQSRIANIRIGDAMEDPTPSVKYNLENNIYSSMVLLDDVGSIVNTQEYYPFGETSFGSYAKKRYQYVGKERDEESGLYYYGARYYAPWVARFISVDPLSAQYAQLSPYNYSDNNPINDYDIDGMQNNNSANSEGPKPITVKINGTENETRDEVESKLPVHAADKQKMIFEFDSSDGQAKSSTFEYNEKEKSWYLMESVLSPNNLIVNYQDGKGIKWTDGESNSDSTTQEDSTVKTISKSQTDNNSEEKVITKAINFVDKGAEMTSTILSNKIVSNIINGGGLLSSMVETAATSAKKETITNVKKANKTLVKNNIKATPAKIWKKTARIFSKIKSFASFTGRVFGITDLISNAAEAWKVGRNKNATFRERINAGGKLFVSFVSLFFRATPMGFLSSFALSIISGIIFK